MLRILFSSSIILILFGCTPKNKPNDFADPETITIDNAFRETIDTGDFVKLSAGYTYYEFENKNADTLLVMVHGFSVPSYIWDSTYHAAIKRGYGALRYDVYGRGYSDKPDVVYDGALYSGQLKDLLDALQINRKINLLGLSFGGRVISAFAFQYPERIQNLIYVDPAGFETVQPGVEYPVMVSEEEVVEFKKSENYATMAQGQLSDFYDSKPFTGWDKQYEEVMKFKGFVRALISSRTNAASLENEQKKIALSGIPVYAFWGEHDTVVPLNEVKENIKSRMPALKLFIIPDAGHLPHMEQTQLFNSILFDEIVCCGD